MLGLCFFTVTPCCVTEAGKRACADHASADGGDLCLRGNHGGDDGAGDSGVHDDHRSPADGGGVHKVTVPVTFGRSLIDPYMGFLKHTVVADNTITKNKKKI